MPKQLLRRLAKIVAYGILALVLLIAIAISFTVGWRPIIGPKARPATDHVFERTPERLERGRYLVESTVGCFECHSQFDEKPSDVPVMTSKKGSGRVFLEQGDFRVVASNITPDEETGVGSWSDDEIARAIREGLGKDGRALFPIMPYEEYRHLSDDDLASVIVYLRSIEPVRSELPKTQLPFPLSRLVNTFPEPVTGPMPQPDMSNPVKRGEYLAWAGGCYGCHSPSSGPPKMQRIEGLEFAGGNVSEEVASKNLTPDASGIPYYDEALFLEVMRTGHVKARKLEPPMPWWLYRNMVDDDLKALFAYLRTLKPVKHNVDNQEPPTDCKLCGNKHGLGEQN